MLFVLTGPESSGKSTLAKLLSEHFQALMIEEVAREYLQSNTQYLPSDLLEISALHQHKEAQTDARLTFADTDHQVLYIWWQERFGPVPSRLLHAYGRQSARHYLLCAPDLAWQPDPLRENPHDRERLFELYERDLRMRGLSFDIISGQADGRFNKAVQAVEARLSGQRR